MGGRHAATTYTLKTLFFFHAANPIHVVYTHPLRRAPATGRPLQRRAPPPRGSRRMRRSERRPRRRARQGSAACRSSSGRRRSRAVERVIREVARLAEERVAEEQRPAAAVARQRSGRGGRKGRGRQQRRGWQQRRGRQKRRGRQQRRGRGRSWRRWKRRRHSRSCGEGRVATAAREAAARAAEVAAGRKPVGNRPGLGKGGEDEQEVMCDFVTHRDRTGALPGRARRHTCYRNHAW